jgi:hypothetical protein
VLGIIALSFTLISVFTLSGPGPFSLLRRHESVVLKHLCRMHHSRGLSGLQRVIFTRPS